MKEINYENVINYSSQKFVMNIIPALISTNNYNETCKSIINKKLNNNIQYIKLCETLIGFLKYYSTDSNKRLCNNNVCCEYLNYWLNSQGREVNIPDNNTLVFYNIIKGEFPDNTLWGYCNSKIHHIEDFEFKKYDILYKIHDAFNRFKFKKANALTRNDSCENAQECVNLYNSIISLCHLHNDTSFCKALNDLKNKIEQEGWLNNSGRMCNTYEFFKEIMHYEAYASMIDNGIRAIYSIDDCFIPEHVFNEKSSKINNLCGKLRKLSEIIHEDRNKLLVNNSSKHTHYMNYWLNDQFKKDTTYDTVDVNDFCNKMQLYNQFIDSEDKINCTNIRKIDESEFGKMKILRNIYYKYHQKKLITVNQENKISVCLDYLIECIDEYKKAITYCPEGSTKNFCKALADFQNLYNKTTFKSEECRSIKLQTLPTKVDEIENYIRFFQQQNKPENSGSSTFLILGPITAGSLFGFLMYKFSPLGSRLRNRMKNNTGRLNDNNEQEMNKLHNYTSKSENINTNNGKYNVAYNSL
ncbi:hypothetical protein PVIIG_05447 [Plasmodium vivax India VII]|uniref:VIR protein n=1 Tax=Plasmodium vivax India VII TaxID=1077284 RepID=A0A0J9S4W7_PLAVI|nr:hypothetical protein PVIIG_05447 [Plasmodium vivax India VII]